MPTLIEPYRIKTIEPIHLSTRDEREALLAQAGYNLFRVAADAITIDLLTDSGTGAMSTAQWSAIMGGDESYAGAASFHRFERAVRDIFGFRHVLPTHQGRAAERILAATLVRPGQVIPNNTHFDTTRANLEAAGGIAIDLPCLESAILNERHPFKGNIDLQGLRDILDREAGNVPFAMITITNNGGGGQPVSMENLRAASRLCRERGIPLYLDACRFAENTYLIQQRTPEYASVPLLDIAREMFRCADGCTMSAKKDGLANIGGFLCVNDDDVAGRLAECLILTEGFTTYGGLAGRDLDAIAVGLFEALEPRYQEHRHETIRYLSRGLIAAGVPIVEPAGGHAVYIDAAALLPHLPTDRFPGQALVGELYLEAGIRSGEIGSVMLGLATDRHRGNGSALHDTAPPGTGHHELVRLALPRRVYTRSHLDYVIEAAANIQARRKTVPGIRIVNAPRALRHFTACFEREPVACREPALLAVS
jgi:tryptophanase